MPARYLIGIDLGTTNSAVAYVDTAAADPRVRVFEVPQLVAPGEVAPRRQLPSFVYLAGEHRSRAARDRAAVAAGDRGARRSAGGDLVRAPAGGRRAGAQPGRAHGVADDRVGEVVAVPPRRRSPGARSCRGATATARSCRRSPPRRRCSRHVREAWDSRARRRAVRRAGGPGHRAGVVRRGRARADAAGRGRGPATRRSCCSRSRRPRSTRGSTRPHGGKGLGAGERVLVFDVGGGTTDFTLIEVDANGDGFTRTAVGDHLLLGGDNLDLTLAKIVEQRVVAQDRQEARRAAVARPGPRVPAREGDAARRRAARRRADRRRRAAAPS